jgi:AcrR family transcriptional regulator
LALRPRKQPKQARSRQTEAVLLEAGARVLAREGAAAFNTNRVAERAGVSVGSLYQYYPNKAALLFRLHEREVEATAAALGALLGDRSRPPRARLALAVQRFFESEAEERELNRALALARVDFYASAEFRALERRLLSHVRAFLAEVSALRGARLDFETAFAACVVGGAAERAARDGFGPAMLRRTATDLAGILCDRLGLDAVALP